MVQKQYGRGFAMKILVTGGTGKVGSELIKELVKRKVSVRALVRKQEASTKMPEGIEVIQGDLLDPVSVRKALDGVDKLYLLNAVAPDELTQGLIAYDLAKSRSSRRSCITLYSKWRSSRMCLTSLLSLRSKVLCVSSISLSPSFVRITSTRTTSQRKMS